MSARRGKHTRVYAPRGYDFQQETLKERAPLKVENELFQPQAPKLHDPLLTRQLCPHGGEYFNNVPRCGLCFQQPNNGLTPDDSFTAFQLSIYDICKRVAWKHRAFVGIHWKDKIHHAFVSIVGNPKSMLKLMTHLNPFALATRIADCRLTDLERKPVNWNERSVSQLNFGSAISSGEEENSPLSTNVGRLDKISAESQLLEYRLEMQEGVRNFPGARLLWTRTNIQRLMELVQAGIASLPTNSFNYELAIKLKCGALGPKMPWPTLAKTMSAAGGPQFTEKQMRYAIEKAMDHIRVYIMRHLTPDLGEVTDRKLLKTQRFK